MLAVFPELQFFLCEVSLHKVQRFLSSGAFLLVLPQLLPDTEHDLLELEFPVFECLVFVLGLRESPHVLLVLLL